MKLFKKITILVTVLALSAPYTVFAKNETVYSAKEISVLNTDEPDNPPKPENAPPQLLSEEEIALFNDIALQLRDAPDTIDVASHKIDTNRFISVYNTNFVGFIQNAHPELFFYDQGLRDGHQFEYDIVEDEDENVTYPLTKLFPVYTRSEDEISIGKMVIEKDLHSIESQIDESMTDIEKILFVHDYIISHCGYDVRLYYDNGRENRDLDKMIEERRGVCQAYSYYFMYIMNSLGIDCITVPSSRHEHMWNKVKVDGEWYNIDLTSDDPLPDMASNITHEYFLLNDDEIKAVDAAKKENDSDYTVLHSEWDPLDWTGRPVVTSESTLLSDLSIRNIQGPVAYLDNTLYCMNDENSICTVEYNTEEHDFEYDEQYKVIDETIQEEDKSYIWYLHTENPVYEGAEVGPNDLNAYIGYYFTVLAVFDGKMYFNTPDSVYQYNPSEKNASLVYTYGNGPDDIYDISETYLYGLVIKNNSLCAEYTTDPYPENSVVGITRYIPIHELKEPRRPLIETNPCTAEAKLTDEETGEITVRVTIPPEVLMETRNRPRVYVAEYSEDNKLIALRPLDTHISKTLSFVPESGSKTIKTFIWSDKNEPLSYVTPYIIGE